MSKVIRVENLSKRYVIRHEASQYKTTRDAASEALRRLTGRGRDNAGSEEFWALKDISFEIGQGDRVGIIGRNGAGKSTMLKVLSRITQPSKGRVEIWGRIASLLEVGTGFHPELTGRENVYLNGALLGMSRQEIRRKFDEIVAFSEVERFLDTPVKRYSSGMYVRLAFSVAAHLDPEILIVDEVLAVGDAAFQKKSLGKMEEVGKSGRTVLFVSHTMAAVSSFCTKGLMLHGGRMEFFGPTDVAIDRYLESGQTVQSERDLAAYRPSWAEPLITSAKTTDPDGKDTTVFPLGGDLTFEMRFSTRGREPLKDPVMGVIIHHPTFGTVGGVNTRMTDYHAGDGPYCCATMRCTIEKPPLLQGKYAVDLWLGDGAENLDTLSGFLSFEIAETDVYGTGRTPFGHMGVVYLHAAWEILAD